MRRREFIAGLGGAAWPLAVRAQQAPRPRRIGILMPYPPTDRAWQSRVDAFRQELQRLGWAPGGNIELDERWTTDNMDLVRANAANMVELKPEVIVAAGARVIPVLMQLTRTIPIIIPGASDAIGLGYIESLARPGRNVTGFGNMEPTIVGKILETLKQIAPSMSRVAMIYNPDNALAALFQPLFESFALRLSLQPIFAPIRNIADIEREIERLAEQPNGGVFFLPDVTLFPLRVQIASIVARHRVPAVYTDRIYVASGGLVSYDADRIDTFRRTASYVDRILQGEKPGELPFQQPTKYQLTVNLKTAKTLCEAMTASGHGRPTRSPAATAASPQVADIAWESRDFRLGPTADITKEKRGGQQVISWPLHDTGRSRHCVGTPVRLPSTGSVLSLM
jgi:ABC-type uncharacterized transport system substrate-binding protein